MFWSAFRELTVKCMKHIRAKKDMFYYFASPRLKIWFFDMMLDLYLILPVINRNRQISRKMFVCTIFLWSRNISSELFFSAVSSRLERWHQKFRACWHVFPSKQIKLTIKCNFKKRESQLKMTFLCGM